MPEFWSDPLEQRLDRLVSTGRQLVDGVSGARPGNRGAGRRSRASQGAAGFPRLDGLGRWVENKLDWILEDEDDWREPWQEPSPRSEVRPARSIRRRLDAISRRTDPVPTTTSTAPNTTSTVSVDPADWPDDDAFVIPRWQRQAPSADSLPPAPPGSPGRSMPRSTRRRPAG